MTEPRPQEPLDARGVERAAVNEARFREANQRIDGKRRELGVDDRFPLLCECEAASCTRIFLVSGPEYEAARAHPRRFLVLAEHTADARVVSHHDGFVVVEKAGLEGELVEELPGG